ncbi:MAG: MASE1 domain-containing protein [Gemmatimonadaceae bacterium]
MKLITRPGSRLTSPLALGVAVGVVVAACASLGYAFNSPIAGISAIWPAAGVLLGWLLRRSRRDWPAMLVGAFAGSFAVDYASGLSLRLALAGPLINVLESGVAALVVLRIGGRPFALRSLRQVGSLVVGGAVLSNAVTALLGALVLGRGDSSTFWRHWLVWWAGDGLGMLAFAPLVLTLAPLRGARENFRVGAAAEAAITLAAIGASTWVLTSPLSPVVGAEDSLRYAVFPLLIWTALRHGPWAAASGVALLGFITMVDVARVHLPSGTPPPSVVEFIIYLYVFIALASLSALVPAAVMEERKSATARLGASVERFRQLAERIREAFVEIQLSPVRIDYVSPAWADIWGRPIEEGYDPNVWMDATHPDDQPLLRASLYIAASGEDDTLVFRIKRPDAMTRWIRGRVHAVTDDARRATGVFEDVTEQRLAGERTKQTQKMEALGRLAGGVAHDFNSMLTVIGLSAELIGDALPASHEARSDLDALRRAAASARTLTAQLLSFSRSEPIEPRPVALHALIESASQILARLVGDRVTIVRRLEAREDTVLADRQQLEQVLVNLVVNAGDAMPTGGTLTIATRVEHVTARLKQDDRSPTRSTYVCLSVSDTGQGMSAETRARAFEPFFTTKELGKGTGQGLSTVFSVVQQYGGFVTIQSAEGAGTSVEVYLPALHHGAK